MARFLLLIFNCSISIRQKGRTRVYRKRIPISQSLHRAGTNTAHWVYNEPLQGFPWLSKKKSHALSYTEMPGYQLFQCIVFCSPTQTPVFFISIKFPCFGTSTWISLFFFFHQKVQNPVRCLQGAYMSLHKHVGILRNYELSTRNS